MVALFFTHKIFKPSAKQFGIFNKKGTLTALTAFILIVGLVYQFILRGIWEPKGMQRLVDELLHTIIPLCVFIYWFIYSTKEKINFHDVGIWLPYPVVYLLFVLARGIFSNYYPYPFLNIPGIGTGKVLLNILLILLFMLFIMTILVGIKNRATKNKIL
ncbi:Pr6Pr family membrane protein [Galbibacter sp. EGI 63066]|uniref:Pr6Pr family membrane protein n=1 Tax=Galbibacter sp. EGI 63066 TaxID=2993559 RepID=UPI00224918A1|nr:Pr6Pr family membrane protein [Galbibacter sp. EGI 63066]MCX2681671.1 Pr6Pr family membrane protein [Galbibacter sp. EGI 63066]